MTTPSTPTIAYPIPEARQRLGGISHPTFYKLVKEGRLQVTRLGRRTFVTDAQISACLAAAADSEAA